MLKKYCFRWGIAGLFLLVPQMAVAQGQPQTKSPAQAFFPRQGFLLTGYGGAGYNAVFADGNNPNNFSALFAPIMLFQISDRFLFEGEFEFEIEDGVTATDLEYAQVDVSLNNNFTLIAGKFLLPFSTFSERFHPSWINRLVSFPATYGAHGAAAPPFDPLLPIVKDIGVQLRGAFTTGPFSTITAEVFVTQGPTPAPEEEPAAAPKAVGADGVDEGPVDLAFGNNSADNNQNKLVGGRVGYSIAPYFEVNVSGMTGAYDDTGDLQFSAMAVHLEARHRQFTVHSEIIQTWQEFLPLAADPGKALANHIETLSRNGYWVQLAYRTGKWQPVVRWSQLFKGKVAGETVVEDGRQLALGIDYWFEPTLALKTEYLINDESVDIANNRLAIQLAFAF